jgi:hypothetical protein
MSARIATGLARTDAGVDSFAEAASRAALQLGGAPADLAVVFAGAANLGHAEEGLAAVQDRLHARALLGCGAQGVVGDGRELEEGGVVVWAASLPGAEVETFYLETVPTSETAVAVAGMPELDGADAAIVLVDPYTFPIGPVLAQLADDQPGLPVVGGLASAGGGPGMAVLMHDDELARRGAVGVALSSVDLRVCVSHAPDQQLITSLRSRAGWSRRRSQRAWAVRRARAGSACALTSSWSVAPGGASSSSSSSSSGRSSLGVPSGWRSRPARICAAVRSWVQPDTVVPTSSSGSCSSTSSPSAVRQQSVSRPSSGCSSARLSAAPDESGP